MKVYKFDILFQEVPGHISLAFYVCGCPLRCQGCHSPELWFEHNGFSLTDTLFHSLLDKYAGKISCVLFMGGEWFPKELAQFLGMAESYGLKTALYTGHEDVTDNIKTHLHFLKCGPWIAARGGLSSPTTNQTFWDVKNKIKLNHLFLQAEQQKETP